ncbi:GNAT family N-acetyltransferase [Roseiterribacter gracilis]|uniref:N-acetyltransferase n=1 Tax=Roseiterribacter gracilis TaxID=2812848 RepID=A0A8S8X7I0_9PROT|nr:N-acetyltransferase [Rhodospirillales bacterium TMPK1]
MSHQIRPATRADVPLILALVRELAVYEHLEHEVVADEAAIDEILFGSTAVAEAMIAEWNGAPVGYALFHYTVSTFLGKRTLYLEDLFVRQEARGRGIGRALLERLAAVAFERNCGRLNWCVLDWNQPAIDFYRGLGAELVESWRVCSLSGDALKALADT